LIGPLGGEFPLIETINSIFAWEEAVVIIEVDGGGDAPLTEVRLASGSARGGFSFAEGREEEGCENRDNGDDDEQFNQSEAGLSLMMHHALLWEKMSTKNDDSPGLRGGIGFGSLASPELLGQNH
jgi:hypothetical protein